MSPRATDSRQASEGFTIIELMAALTLLTIGILGLAPVFIASARSASSGMHRARALALATRDIEAYRSVPYCTLGFSTGTAPTVVVPNPAPGIPPASSSETVDGIKYSFNRQIEWFSAVNLQTTATNANAYKQVTVQVNWKEADRTNVVRQNSIIYPGGIGTYTDSGCGASGAAGLQTPPQPVMDLSAATNSSNPDTSIDLSWSNPVSPNFGKYRIVYSTDNFATSFLFNDVPVTVPQPYQISGLTPGATYQFQLLSWRESTGESTPSNRVTVSTLSSASPSCSIGTVGLSHSALKQASGSTLVSDVGVSVNTTSSACSALQLRYVPDEGTGAQTVLPLTGPGPWTGTMDGDATNWSVGPHTLTVTDANGVVLHSSTSLTVCLSGALTCP